MQNPFADKTDFEIMHDCLMRLCHFDAESATFIVHACNQHERLVAGLTMAMHALRSYQYGNSSDQLGRQAANQVEAILAAV